MLFLGFLPSPMVKASEIEYYFPESDDTWDEKSLLSGGLDPNIIEDMYDFIASNGTWIESILISRDGYISHDQYLMSYIRISQDTYGAIRPTDLVGLDFTQIRDDRHACWSVTKSVTSLLTGIAIEQGYLDNVSVKFFDIFSDKWDPTHPNATKLLDITVENLLTMSPGFEWDEATDGFELWPQAYKGYNYSLSYILEKPLAYDPGTNFTYSTGTTELLATLLQNVTNTKLFDFAWTNLFEPIGIEAEDIEWFENPWEWGTPGLENISHGGFGIYATPRVMARIGELCLNNGTWNGTQIVSGEWIYNSTRAHNTPIGLGEDCDYGYLWWERNEPETKYYFANGAFGQQITVVPDLDMVIVFTSDAIPDPVPAALNHIIENFIIPAAKAENLSIGNPLSNIGYRATAPDFEIYAEKPYRNTTWYSLNNLENITFTEFSGTLNQTQWATLPTGSYLLTFYANSSTGEIINKTTTIIKDIDDPIINVEIPYDSYNTTAPTYTISIVEDFLVRTCYTLDDGETNITITDLDGTIDEDLWADLPDGNVTITFYAIDIAGNIGSYQVDLTKITSTSSSEEAIPGYPLLAIFGVLSIGVVLISIKLKSKNH